MKKIIFSLVILLIIVLLSVNLYSDNNVIPLYIEIWDLCDYEFQTAPLVKFTINDVDYEDVAYKSDHRYKVSFLIPKLGENDFFEIYVYNLSYAGVVIDYTITYCFPNIAYKEDEGVYRTSIFCIND